MYYTNSMKLTLKNEETASLALEIMKQRLSLGFDVDHIYKNSPSTLMLDNFFVEGCRISVPEEFGCLVPEDAKDVQIDLIRHLAKYLKETFSCEIYNYCDCSESEIAVQFNGQDLNVSVIYYPDGYGENSIHEEYFERVA